MARSGRPAPGAGVVGVVGARGGAGATVTAAALAAELARRGTTVLVDTGPGPSVDTVLGLEAHPGLRWPDLDGARGAVDPALLAGNLMRWGRCGVLPTDDVRPGPPPPGALGDVVRALAAAHGSVVLDLDRAAVLGVAAAGGPVAGDEPAGADGPAGAGAPAGADGGVAVRGATLLAACRTVLVVVPRDVPAVAGARLLRDGLVGAGRRVGLVARAPAPGGLGVEEVAAAVGLPVVASLPWVRGLGAAVDSGVGPVVSPRLAGAVQRLARRLT